MKGKNDLILFKEIFSSLGGKLEFINDINQFKECFSTIFTPIENKKVAIERGLEIFGVSVSSILNKLNISIYDTSKEKTDYWRRAAEVDIGITMADWAIADSGTLVLQATPNRPRWLSLLPPIHIAFLKKERISPDVISFFRERPLDPAKTTSLILISGPSRTADIEQKIILGAHGPKELYLFIL